VGLIRNDQDLLRDIIKDELGCGVLWYRSDTSLLLADFGGLCHEQQQELAKFIGFGITSGSHVAQGLPGIVVSEILRTSLRG